MKFISGLNMDFSIISLISALILRFFQRITLVFIILRFRYISI